MSSGSLDRAIGVAIGRIIDPEAFASGDPALAERRSAALAKAKKIERMEFDFDELGAALQGEIEAVEAAAAAEPLIYPAELTPALKEVLSLGWTPWVLRDVWTVLRACGQPIATKAEEEGSAALHFLIPFALEHGDAWRAAVGERLRTMKAELKGSGA